MNAEGKFQIVEKRPFFQGQLNTKDLVAGKQYMPYQDNKPDGESFTFLGMAPGKPGWFLVKSTGSFTRERSLGNDGLQPYLGSGWWNPVNCVKKTNSREGVSHGT